MKPAKADTVRLGGTPRYREVVDDVLRQMPDAGWADACPMCGRSGAHGHSAVESLIYTNGVKLGMRMAKQRHPNEGKLMFVGGSARS